MQYFTTAFALQTGQTISLSGFLDKLKKRTESTTVSFDGTMDGDFYPASVKRQRRSYYGQASKSPTANADGQAGQDYVLMPATGRKVLVGKTPDGKNIIGKILQVRNQRRISSQK